MKGRVTDNGIQLQGLALAEAFCSTSSLDAEMVITKLDRLAERLNLLFRFLDESDMSMGARDIAETVRAATESELSDLCEGVRQIVDRANATAGDLVALEFTLKSRERGLRVQGANMAARSKWPNRDQYVEKLLGIYVEKPEISEHEARAELRRKMNGENPRTGKAPSTATIQKRCRRLVEEYPPPSIAKQMRT